MKQRALICEKGKKLTASISTYQEEYNHNLLASKVAKNLPCKEDLAKESA